MDARSFSKHRARRSAVALLHDLERIRTESTEEEIQARNEARRGPVCRYLEALEAVAAFAPTLLEASCTPRQWESLRRRLDAQETLPLRRGPPVRLKG